MNSIIHGDCIELFKSIPDNSIDVTFADPPFNLKKGYNSYKDRLAIEQYLEWCQLWMLEMVRVTKPSGSIFVHNIPKWLIHYAAFLNTNATFKHWIAWDAPTAPMGKSLQPNHYGILYYAKDKPTFYELRYPHKRARKTNVLLKDYGGKKHLVHPFGPLVSDVWSDIHRLKHNKYRDEHPCQLPVHLLERIILMASDEGDIILDPFTGTGTTLIAAKRLGRNYIGFELDHHYVQIANNKLSQEQPNSKLGNSWVSYYNNSIATIRDIDWSDLQAHFSIPTDIVHYPITLRASKSK